MFWPSLTTKPIKRQIEGKRSKTEMVGGSEKTFKFIIARTPAKRIINRQLFMRGKLYELYESWWIQTRLFVLECISAEAETTNYFCSTVGHCGFWRFEGGVSQTFGNLHVRYLLYRIIIFSITSCRQNRRRVNGFFDVLAAAHMLTPVRRANTTMCPDTLATRRHIDLFIRPC